MNPIYSKIRNWFIVFLSVVFLKDIFFGILPLFPFLGLITPLPSPFAFIFFILSSFGKGIALPGAIFLCILTLLGAYKFATTKLKIIALVAVGGILILANFWFFNNYLVDRGDPERNAREALEKGNYSDALKEYDKLLKNGLTWVYPDRGELYYNLEEYTDALNDFKKCSETSIENEKLAEKVNVKTNYKNKQYVCYEYKALTYFKLKDYKNAVYFGNRLYENDPGNSGNREIPYWFNGGLYFSLGKYDLALVEYKKIIEKRKEWNQGEYADPFIAMANAQIKIELTKDALENLNRAIILRDTDDQKYKNEKISPYFYLGDYYLYTGNKEKALENYKVAEDPSKYSRSSISDAVKMAKLAQSALLAHEKKYKDALKILPVFVLNDSGLNKLESDYLDFKLYLYKKMGDEKELKQLENQINDLKYKGLLFSSKLSHDSQEIGGIPLLFQSFEERADID